MKIDRRRVGTVDIHTPLGPLVDDGAAALVDVLNQTLAAPNARVVLAMDEVGYMDSAALEGLLSAAEALSERNMNLKLAGLTPTCREVLELTGLSRHFQLFNDVESAVRSFL